MKLVYSEVSRNDIILGVDHFWVPLILLSQKP